VLGVIGLAVFFALGWARKVVSEVKMLVFGFILITVGLAVVALSDVTGYRKIQFVGGCALVLSFGSPIVQTVILSSFSTVLGSQPQGTLMGIITMAGSLGRIIFPFATKISDQGSFILGSVLSMVSVVGILGYSWWVRWHKRLRPTHQFVVGFPEPVHTRMNQ